MKPLRNAIRRNMKGRLVRYAGLAALGIAAMGSRCTPERDFEPVVTVDVVAPFLAQGSENRYSAGATIDLNDVVDLERLMEENDIEEIRDIRIESLFHRVVRPDSGAANRTVTDNVLTVGVGQGAPANLFEINSIVVNDPRFRDWTSVPLEAGGVALLNAALNELRQGQSAEVTFAISGNSSPADVPTRFIWEARLRLNVIGVHRLKVFEPL